jgi:protein-S-isoprenylcysteine O-methyltransferase Ste14
VHTLSIALNNIHFKAGYLKSLETKIPPPVVLLIVGFAMWQGASFGPGFVLNEIVSWMLIAFFLITGLLIAVLGVIEIVKVNTTINPMRPEKTSSLATQGIYRLTRNPIYLGDAFLLIAWAIYLSSFFMFFGVFVFVLYINRFQIIPEERALKKLFALEYEIYQTKVRRWL